MKFFKKKAKDKAASKIEDAIEKSDVDASMSAESICEVELPAAPVDAIVPPKGTLKASDAKASASLSAVPSSSMHLFPGFEDQGFSIGYNVQGDKSVLMMRWDTQEPSSWFEVPAMFNNAIISKIQERENEKDLSRLLRDYGYAVDRPSLQAAE